ncbi:MAG: fasciclin domain-containing protein [Cyanobacteria bacterium P01_E01_bin.6]
MTLNFAIIGSWTILGITSLSGLPASSQPLQSFDVTAAPDPMENVLIAPDAVRLAQAEFDIVDVATIEGDFDTFLSLFEELGMQEDLRGYGRFTVFAPVDAAFEALEPEVLEALLGDRELLSKVLSYHVIASGTPIYSTDITRTLTHRTLERSSIEIRPRGSSIYVEGVRVIDEDIEASNGVIHVIDEVLIPPDILEQLP